MKATRLTIALFVLLSPAVLSPPAGRAEAPRLLYLAKNRELESPKPPKTALVYVKRDTWHETVRASLEATFAPVVEKDGRGSGKRSRKGTPQGGVISPLLANIYLHEMDRAFYEEHDGPYRAANARLVRYADDFVILARYIGPRIIDWVEEKLEGDLGLKVNRDKTSIVRMDKRGEALDFLGFTLRYDQDLKGRNMQYLNVVPSKKAIRRLRDKIRQRTQSGYKAPLKDVIEQINVILRGWASYYHYGYPRSTFRGVNHFVRCRFQRFVRNRSQRRSKPFRQGESLYAGLKRYGLVYL